MAEFIETYDVSRAGLLLRDFFLGSRKLTGLQPYGPYAKCNQWVPSKDFRAPELNYLLGKAVEEMLPQNAVTALRNLSLGGYPRVVVLNGLPIGAPGDDVPETGFPFSAATLRAVSALLIKRDHKWEKAVYGSIFLLESNSGTEQQAMHCDYTNDDDGGAFGPDGPNTRQVYSLLHYRKTDGETPTWFGPYAQEDAKQLPDRSRHIPVVAQDGDLVVFNNLRVIHARGEPASSSSVRNFVGINVRDYSPMNIELERPMAQNASAQLVEAVL